MKILIIYLFEIGNIKMVCEKVFEYINGEKVIIFIKEEDSINLDEFDNIVVGIWIDKVNVNVEVRKFINILFNKKIFFIGILVVFLEFEYVKKCFNNFIKFCFKKNNFVDGVLIRGKVLKDL